MSQHNYFLGNSGKLIKFDAHKTPEFKEKRSVDWMLYGTDEFGYSHLLTSSSLMRLGP